MVVLGKVPDNGTRTRELVKVVVFVPISKPFGASIETALVRNVPETVYDLLPPGLFCTAVNPLIELVDSVSAGAVEATLPDT